MSLEVMYELRNEIIGKRQILTKIKLGKANIETDKILSSLTNQIELYSTINSSFHNKDQTKLNLVLNADQLSLAESQLIVDRLKELNLEVYQIILNKFSPEQSKISDKFEIMPQNCYSLVNYPLIGIENLNRYLREDKNK